MDDLREKRTSIASLPVEIIENIFDYLPLAMLKEASLVCRQWSETAFSGRRMGRILLKLDFDLYERRELLKLQYSQRQYRNLWASFSKCYRHLNVCCAILRQFGEHIECLELQASNPISVSQLRRTLKEVPNLRALSLLSYLDEKSVKNLKPFSVLEKLTDLALGSYGPLKNNIFDIVAIAPNLQSLNMDCDSERAVEVFKHYSSQLKSLAVTFKRNDLFQPFCDIKFAQLEEIHFYDDDFMLTDDLASPPIETFFQGLTRLKRAKLRLTRTDMGMVLCIIYSNCRDLVELSLDISWWGATGATSLVGLSQLTKLKVLQLHSTVRNNVFDGCKPIPSLQKLVLVNVRMISMLRFFDCLFIVAPQLSSLDVAESGIDVECLLFICDHFSSLERLRLDFCPEINEKGFTFLNRLPRLRSLELDFFDFDSEFFRNIPPNTVRDLKLYRCDKLQIIDPYHFTSIFPSLQELYICDCDLITDNDIRLLRASMGQSCSVIFHHFCCPYRSDHIVY